MATSWDNKSRSRGFQIFVTSSAKGAIKTARSYPPELEARSWKLEAALRARIQNREIHMPDVVVAKPREGKFNKIAARRVRAAGKIPAVLYGAGHDAIAVEVDPKQITRILFSEPGHNTIFDVEVAGVPSAT